MNRPTPKTMHQAAACGGLLCALVSLRSERSYQDSTWSLDHLPSAISKQLPLVGNSFETSLKLGGGGM